MRFEIIKEKVVKGFEKIDFLDFYKKTFILTSFLK
jgi:hypothetical protein